MVTLKIWSTQWQNKNVVLFCDNLAVVEVLTSGKTKDEYLATCGRNVCMLTALFNIHLTVLHIPGKANKVADLLSRWSITTDAKGKLNQLLPNHVWVPTHPDLLKLNTCI